MLLLGSKSITVDGIQVFPDHADPNQFWYLPGPVALARRLPDRRAAFTFIKYKPAAVSGGAKGGGFAMFETALRLDPAIERRILGKLSAIARGTPRLAAVPFDEGTVRCVALNLEGSGGTTAEPAGPGSFAAVEKVLGATSPSLAGDNNAAFSLTLSQEGAIILEKAFEQGTTPVGVIYELKYSGMRPALNVKITAHLERVYEQFSADLEAQVYFMSAGIEAGFEKLVQDGAIKIEVTDFTGEDDEKEKEKWALDFFKEKLLSEWFTPTLTPGQVAGGGADARRLEDVVRTGNALNPPRTPAPPRPNPSAPAPVRPPSPNASAPRPTQGHGTPNQPAAAGAPSPPAAGTATAGTAPRSPTEGTGLPQSSPTVPRQAAGLNFPAPAQGALGSVADGGRGGGGLPLAVSFKLKYVRQEERKTVVIEYNRQEATQRSYNPQGFFGLLTADLQKSHFVEVDLDDPFFRVFEVRADAPFDFDRIGLTSAQVALDYGEGPARKHKDFQFDKEDPAEKKWEVFMVAPTATAYESQVQFHFSPDSGWEGEKFSYELPRTTTEDRTLLLNPHDHIGFLDVQLVPDRIDWGVVESIKVKLDYADSAGWSRTKTFLFTEQTAIQHWRLRLNKKDERAYTQTFVCRLKDGTEKTTEPVTTEATLVPVSDPLPGELAVEFVPLFDSSSITMVFIDFEYEDPANDYSRTERMRVARDAVEPIPLRISLFDPAHKKFRYRFTFVRAGQMDQKPFVETEDTLVGVV